jgi:hypothetical protein
VYHFSIGIGYKISIVNGWFILSRIVYSKSLNQGLSSCAQMVHSLWDEMSSMSNHYCISRCAKSNERS